MQAVLPFPDISPELISVTLFGAEFALRWYALAYIAGLLLGWRLVVRLVKTGRLWQGGRAPMAPGQVEELLTWVILGVILGGRLGFVLLYKPLHYLQNPMEIPMLWQGGMSFHGGFAGTVFAMVLFAWKRGLKVWTLFDLAGCAAPIGLFFGRIANFINSELWGRPADVPWAVVFPTGGPEPRHPSQLYEAALEGIVLFLVLRLLSHRFKLLQKRGFLAGAFACGYGIARSIAEVYRVPDAHIGYLGGFLTMGILLSLPMILAGLAAMVWAARRPVTEAA